MPSQPVSLKRSLSLLDLSLYGLGTILGAGIYVLIGAVAARAGIHMPLAFIVAALVAAPTALAYAELGARYPVSAGEAKYIDAAFSRRSLTLSIGLAVVAVGIISAATIANGFAAYLRVLWPVPPGISVTVLIVALGTLAAIGVQASVWAANAVTIISVIGLVWVMAIAGAGITPTLVREALVPGFEIIPAIGILSGAVLAFYAFIGFEDMVNLAEEVHQPERNLPLAIFIALGVASLLYGLVALAAAGAVPVDQLAGSDAPLALVFAARGYDNKMIAVISLIAVVNGALVQIVMASRVLYGLARDQNFLAPFKQVSPITRTPLNATIASTVLVLTLALTLPLVKLAAITSSITLVIFALVNLALVWLRLTKPEPTTGGIQIPLWIPICGGVFSAALVLFSFIWR